MTPRYIINDEFFDQWNEESAYVLGYFYALASIYRGPDNSRHEIVISGTELGLLEQIMDVMLSTYPIRQINGSYQVRICSKRLVERLEEIGLVPNKSKNLEWPRGLPRMQICNFIRGYFDGKGSFMREPGRRIIANISGGSYKFIETLRDELVLKGLTRANIHQYGADKATNVIRYYVKDTRKLYGLLYRGARIYSRDQVDRYNTGI
jgi:hypothetical protein